MQHLSTWCSDTPPSPVGVLDLGDLPTTIAEVTHRVMKEVTHPVGHFSEYSPLRVLNPSSSQTLTDKTCTLFESSHVPRSSIQASLQPHSDDQQPSPRNPREAASDNFRCRITPAAFDMHIKKRKSTVRQPTRANQHTHVSFAT